MSAPISKDTPDLEGVWKLNKDLSNDPDQIFELQGVPWIIRKVLKYANLSLKISQVLSTPNPPEETPLGPSCDKESEKPFNTLLIKQTVTVSPGSLGNFDSDGSYPINGKKMKYSLPIFGDITMQLRYADTAEISDDILRQKLTEGSPSKTVIDEVAKNEAKGWDARVLWGFEIIDGNRYLTRNIITTKDEKLVKSRLVYDFKVQDSD